MAAVKDFSVEEKLVNLLKLQKIDSKLDEIKVLRGELPMEVSDLEDEITGLKSRQVRIEEEINGITEYMEGRKAAIKDSEALIAKYEKQSDQVKNNREYEAINKEIEMQQLEIKLCEKNIRDANDELAEKVKVLDAARKQVAVKEGVLAHKKGNWKKSLLIQKKKKLNSINSVVRQELILTAVYCIATIAFAPITTMVWQ